MAERLRQPLSYCLTRLEALLTVELTGNPLQDASVTGDHNDFGRITSLRADATGLPGQRRFRLVVEASNGRSALLWLEKEQLFNLGLALKRLIAETESLEERSRERVARTGEAEEAPPVPGPHSDFQVGRIEVGYDGRRRLYLIAAYSAESPEDSRSPDVALKAARAQVDALADEAFRVCAAGRPLCPLCHASLGPEPHVCPRHNGHGRLQELQE